MSQQRSIALLKSEAHKIGGLEKHTQKIKKAFELLNWRVNLLTTSNAPNKNELKTPKGPSYRKIIKFDNHCSSWIRENTPDVVLSMDRNRKSTHIRAGSGCHLSYLQTRIVQEGFLKQCSFKFNPLHRTILSIEKESFESPQTRAIITNSNMVKNEILNNYRVNREKIFVIHNGVEHIALQDSFSSWNLTKEKFCKKHKLDKDCLHILFVGNGFARKGLEPLLRALATLQKKNFILSVVGKDKKMASFQRLADSLQLNGKVIFWGPQKNMIPFFSAADCLAIPSFYDPFANVTIEALSMGLFVVSSKTNGGSEIIQNNGSIIEDMYSIESIAASLKEAFCHPKIRQTAEKTRNSVAHLDFSNQMEKFIKVILSTS